MLIPPDYTPVQITVPDDNQCNTIYNMWHNIYRTNQDTYSYISYISLAVKYNLIYALIKTDNLKLLRYPYTVVPLISSGNINYYKLNNTYQLVLKEENNIQEIVTFDGSKFWFKDGNLNRDNGLPAAIYTDGTQAWYQNGEYHRNNDLPAIIYADGTQLWYQNGNLHRDNDLPAIIYPDGSQAWYQNGRYHRDNDLPAIIYFDESKLWYKHGVKYDYPS